MSTQEELSPEEKIKQLLSSEKEQKKSLEEKKKELERKKKELEELEKKTESEREIARKELQEQIEELALEEKERFEELERIRKEREQESLEETVADEIITTDTEVKETKGYGDAINEVLQGTPNFYDITNYNVMNRLERLANEASSRNLTNNEQKFVETVEYHIKKFGKDDFYKDKDSFEYLRKEQVKIDYIQKKAKDENTMKRGDYVL